MNQPAPISHPRNPLHGITLETIVTQLVQRHGWEKMGRRIPVRCFLHDPSVKSSLTFLRKTPWARQKVERWFIAELLKRKRRNLTTRRKTGFGNAHKTVASRDSAPAQ